MNAQDTMGLDDLGSRGAAGREGEGMHRNRKIAMQILDGKPPFLTMASSMPGTTKRAYLAACLKRKAVVLCPLLASENL
jgi:hypothetical protein